LRVKREVLDVDCAQGLGAEWHKHAHSTREIHLHNGSVHAQRRASLHAALSQSPHVNSLCKGCYHLPVVKVNIGHPNMLCWQVRLLGSHIICWFPHHVGIVPTLAKEKFEHFGFPYNIAPTKSKYADMPTRFDF